MGKHLYQNSLYYITVADPDLQIKAGGGGGGHPDSEIGPVSKNFFLALRASFWSETKGEAWDPWAPPLDPPMLNAPMVHCPILLARSQSSFPFSTKHLRHKNDAGQ